MKTRISGLLAICALLVIPTYAGEEKQSRHIDMLSEPIGEVACSYVDDLLDASPWYVMSTPVEQGEYRADLIAYIGGCIDKQWQPGDRVPHDPFVTYIHRKPFSLSLGNLESVKEMSLSVIAGGDDFRGVQGRYRLFGARLGEFDSGRNSRDALLAEALFFLPLPGGQDCAISAASGFRRVPVFCRFSGSIGIGGVFREGRSVHFDARHGHHEIAHNSDDVDLTYSLGIEYIFPFRLAVGIVSQRHADIALTAGYGLVWSGKRQGF